MKYTLKIIFYLYLFANEKLLSLENEKKNAFFF